MALLAIQMYTGRNQTCHAKIGGPSIAGDPRALRETIAQDIRRLPEVLPESRMESREILEKLMNFYGDSEVWLRQQKQFERDREESHPTSVPVTLPPPGESSIVVRDVFRDMSPVNSRSVSPRKRTVSGSLKLARDEPSTVAGPADPGEGLHASDGILEGITKLQLKDGDIETFSGIRVGFFGRRWAREREGRLL
ncbi:hypothetical protein BDW62DRAFT_202561 [Aspergillus aurantiobrunneus]